VSPRPAAALAATVAHAAHAAHTRDIVHRDIKPGNVLLVDGPPRANESDPAFALVPKLSDFGLAKRIDRNEGLTVDPGTLGTPNYMAPEQTTGVAVTPRTDVYGLGATLYHAVTGVPPFEGDNIRKVVDQVCSTDPRRVRAVCPDVPVDLEAVVHKCLEKDPANRYASAADLAADLDRFLAGEPVLARPLTPLRRARRAVLRQGRTLGRVAVGALALAVVFSLGAVLRAPEEPPEVKALKKMQSDLTAKKAVTLLGKTGTPPWHKWLYGPGAFALSAKREDACMFQMFGPSMLELCPDPMTDRYRVRAELCQLSANQLDGDGVYEIGLYFGRQSVTGNGGWHSDVALFIWFTDAPLSSRAGCAGFGRIVLSEAPNTPPSESRSKVKPVKYTPPAALPGPWHVVEFEVTPEGVKSWFDPTEGKPGPFADLPVERIALHYSAPNKVANNSDLNNGMILPEWNPRGALGVWAHDSALAVRNVTVTPLK
jgi:eukaryotic-like serine/threonine-protein kinase